MFSSQSRHILVRNVPHAVPEREVAVNIDARVDDSSQIGNLEFQKCRVRADRRTRQGSECRPRWPLAETRSWNL